MIFIDANTISEVASYNEPSTQADGSPLTDLAFTSVFYQIDTAPSVKVADVPASSPSGGRAQTVVMRVPIPVGNSVVVSFHVTATDISGLESLSSPVLTLHVDRLAPSAPTNFTIA